MAIHLPLNDDSFAVEWQSILNPLNYDSFEFVKWRSICRWRTIHLPLDDDPFAVGWRSICRWITIHLPLNDDPFAVEWRSICRWMTIHLPLNDDPFVAVRGCGYVRNGVSGVQRKVKLNHVCFRYIERQATVVEVKKTWLYYISLDVFVSLWNCYWFSGIGIMSNPGPPFFTFVTVPDWDVDVGICWS